MATRKTPARKTPVKSAPVKGKGNKWASVQLPDGFKAITAGEYGEPWDYETNPVLTGIVAGPIREMEVGKGRDKRMARIMTIETDDGRFDVWDSAALRAFFDKADEGMTVSVAFQGYRDTGKASPMKVFVGAIAEDDLPDDKPARKTSKARR